MPVILDSSIPESTRTGVIVLQVLYGLFFIMGISKPKFYRKLSTNVASYFSRSVNTDNFYSYSIQDACHMYFLIDHPLRRVSVAQRWSIGARNPKVWFLMRTRLLVMRIFLCPTLVKRRKTSFSGVHCWQFFPCIGCTVKWRKDSQCESWNSCKYKIKDVRDIPIVRVT